MSEALDAKHESDTKRDGFLSYAGEVHALVIGLSVGFASGVAGTYEIAGSLILATFGFKGFDSLRKAGKEEIDEGAIGEVRREPWYAAGGALCGLAVGTVARLAGGG